MPVPFLFFQDRYLFLLGLIDAEEQPDYAIVHFKWKMVTELRKMENYLAVEIWLLKSENIEGYDGLSKELNLSLFSGNYLNYSYHQDSLETGRGSEHKPIPSERIPHNNSLWHFCFDRQDWPASHYSCRYLLLQWGNLTSWHWIGNFISQWSPECFCWLRLILNLLPKDFSVFLPSIPVFTSDCSLKKDPIFVIRLLLKATVPSAKK